MRPALFVWSYDPASDNYNELKELGQTGDSFNKIIGILLKRFKIEGGKI